MKPTTVALPTLNVAVGTDNEGRVNITDLWKAGGGVHTKRPVIWLAQEQGRKYLAATAKREKVTQNDLLKKYAGRNGGTFAHKLVALEYARYLSPKLAVDVNKVFFDVYENPEATSERMIQGMMRRGMTAEQAATRLMGIGVRKLFAATLARAGVASKGFGVCTKLIYTPLFGGSTDKIKERKGLPAGANVRDYMNVQELSAVMLIESTSASTIEANGIKGQRRCEDVCGSVAKAVADMIKGQRQKFSSTSLKQLA